MQPCYQCGKPSEHLEDWDEHKIFTCPDGHRTGVARVDGYSVAGSLGWLLELSVLNSLPSFWDEQK